MRHGCIVVVVWVAACSSFTSGDDAATDAGVDSGIDADRDGGQDAGPLPSADQYRDGAPIDCPEDEAGVCHLPMFCCVRALADNICASQGCEGAEDVMRVNCRDDTACGQGFLCCVHVSSYHAAVTTCERACDTSVADGGTGTFHVCGTSGDGVCGPGKTCAAIENALGNILHPNPHLNVCQ